MQKSLHQTGASVEQFFGVNMFTGDVLLLCIAYPGVERKDTYLLRHNMARILFFLYPLGIQKSFKL